MSSKSLIHTRVSDIIEERHRKTKERQMIKALALAAAAVSVSVSVSTMPTHAHHKDDAIAYLVGEKCSKRSSSCRYVDKRIKPGTVITSKPGWRKRRGKELREFSVIY